MGLAAQRPVGDDPPPGSPGARKSGWAADAPDDGVSEFFTAELSAVLDLGRDTAAYRHTRAHTWTTKLPATPAALQAGELDERRATALAEVLAHTSPEVAGRVEAALLEAADVHVQPSPTDGRSTPAADPPTEEAVECWPAWRSGAAPPTPTPSPRAAAAGAR